ncbi:MAG TPA: TldD/PmbA family protein [Candidatus Desulfofervidus auxilii]|uniref:TldD/PmbA family protein n=1 Tax=Desulfofervidus auxilii TaxID=1621989 RepID=A0A7C0Y632_DESA2|nr:TldD/PmbA family protein [Candidatus Desulfofervidus auxilii]
MTMEKLEKILPILKKNADLADIFWEETISTFILCENKKLEKVSIGKDVGIGMRILKKGKTIYGFTNDMEFPNLKELASFLSQEIKYKDVSQTYPIEKKPSVESLVKTPPWETELIEKAKFVQKAEKLVWQKSSFVRQVKVLYRENIRNTFLITSLGHAIRERQVRVLFYVLVVVEKDGILQTGYEPIGITGGLELFENFPPEHVAEIATERALKMLFARPAPSGSMPVVLSGEAGGTMIHEAIGHGLEADLALEGLSVYANKLGEQVASPLITVVDDPTIPQQFGSYIYDDEGIPAQRTILIENGVLKSYLYNLEYALKQGVESNGHGRRQSYRFKPIPRMTNTYIAPGKTPPSEIIKQVEKGIFVKKMGGGQVNTINGDFVFEAEEAYLIEKGKIGEPVRGATLVGNGPTILKSITMIGNDLYFGIGTCGKDGQNVPVSDGQPTLLIPEMVVGGTA